jgi:hypothetical protein
MHLKILINRLPTRAQTRHFQPRSAARNQRVLARTSRLGVFGVHWKPKGPGIYKCWSI